MGTAVVIGLPKVMAKLSDLGKNQIPFAVSLMLNATARDVQAAESRHVTDVFDRPKPFTRNAFGITMSNKRKLSAKVFAKEIQNEYLATQVAGGPRDFKTFEERFASGTATKIAVPGKGAKLDQHGNISKAQIKRIARDLNTSGGAKRFFHGTPKGGKRQAGIYTRVDNNTRIEPLLVFADEAVYQKRFQFSAIASATVTEQYEKNLIAAWNKAVSTAK